MVLELWREIVCPNRGVFEGSFKQSEFAVDITQVAKGSSPEEYREAERFFARTHITEGVRLLSMSVGSEISSRVTIHGPQAPLDSKFLPAVNDCRW